MPTADALGNVYVANYTRQRHPEVHPDRHVPDEVGDAGHRTRTVPNAVRRRGGDRPGAPATQSLYVADANNNRMQQFHTNGNFVTQVGGSGETDRPRHAFGLRRLAVAADGDLWAADLWAWRLERWDRTASGFTFVQTIGAVGPAPGRHAVFNESRGWTSLPAAICGPRHGPPAFVRLTAAGGWSGVAASVAEDTRWEFNWPRGLAIDPATGNLWIADTKQNQLQVLTDSCQGVGFIKNEPAGTDERSFNWPYDIAIRPSDRFAFVVDTQNHRIKAYDVAHATWPTDNKGPMPAYVFGSRGTANTNFQWPSAVAVGRTVTSSSRTGATTGSRSSPSPRPAASPTYGRGTPAAASTVPRAWRSTPPGG